MARAARLTELGRIAREYGPGLAERKRALLAELARTRLGRARDVLALHEVLCFLRAHPDDSALLAVVVRELERFASRADLRRFRAELADTGVAGTELHFPFHWVTARWLASHWPDALEVDFSRLGEREQERFEILLPLLLPYAEWPDFDLPLTVRGWLSRAKGPGQTDASFLIERFAALRAEPRVRERACFTISRCRSCCGPARTPRPGLALGTRSGRRSTRRVVSAVSGLRSAKRPLDVLAPSSAFRGAWARASSTSPASRWSPAVVTWTASCTRAATTCG